MEPLISIVIPCFNAEKYISETIQSVFSQDYTNWELIIVNDGSTDGSKKIIESFKKRDQRVSILNKINTGVSDSRNKGLALAKGDFITFLDADDVWCASNLKEKIAFLSSPNFDLVYSYCQVVNENLIPYGSILKGKSSLSLEDFLSLKGNYNTAPSGVVFKKAVMEDVGGYDINLSNNADQDILIQALVNNFKIGLIPTVLWDYRVHLDNMSKNVDVLEKDTIYLLKKCASMKLYKSFWFKQKCKSITYYMLAGSWWKNANNKSRGIYFLCLAFLNFPPSIQLIFKKK